MNTMNTVNTVNKMGDMIRWTNRRYLDAVADHVVLFDGATGTELAKYELGPADFGGERTEGLMEMLLFHRPEVVAQVHATYFEAGAEVVETNTFRGNRVSLAEFGVGDRALEINRRAAEIARQAADRVAAESGRPRFVAGAMGPTGKLLSMEAGEEGVTFDEIAAVYAEQAHGLLEGGVDLLLLETQQDLLELKAAIQGVWRTFHALGQRVPIQAQVTLDVHGRMLTGPSVEAALATLAALPVDVIGLNCSTGPEEMRGAVRRLLALTRHPVSVLPNAGMPESVNGRAVYHMAAEPFADALATFVEWGVRIVGGCCGTGPEHIRQIAAALTDVDIPQPRPAPPDSCSLPLASCSVPYVASNVDAVALHQEPRPLLVGERVNTQGSRKARRLVLAEEYDALASLAESQVASGAHVLDVCVALTERADEAATMQRVVKLLTLNSSAPLMIDTTDLEVMRAALATYPGRAIINSVHLEAGEGRARRILALARDFGAAVVALTIDEQGMAKTAERKMAIAERLYHLSVDEMGLPPHGVIFDPLTFTLATGDADSAGAAVATLTALEQIKARYPQALINLGVSNVSYGLTPRARHVLNSVFLYRAVEAGLDMAIVNPAQITPYPEIAPEARALAEDVIFNRSPSALHDYIAYFADQEEMDDAALDESVALPPNERLYQAILHRRREGVEALIEATLEEEAMAPLAVLNDVLLPAMKKVGERFGAGELILPFVLQSAEVMKAAVAQLEPHLASAQGASKGTIVLATVFGDVHDIGKNLVRTILENNGYTVHDLGKQVPMTEIVDAAVARRADAIGLSALLVATSRQMALVVEELHRRGLQIPVLVGGAAINADFAQRIAQCDSGAIYRGGVFYCEDAFEALQVLENIVLFTPPPPPEDHEHEHEHEHVAAVPSAECATCGTACALSTLQSGPDTIPAPPFWGYRAVMDVPWEELAELLDHKRLFRVGWGAKSATGEQWEAVRADFEARLARMWPEARDYLDPRAVYGYFPAQSQGNDVLIYDPQRPKARREIARLNFPRRQRGERWVSVADYVAPTTGDAIDVVAMQVVTVGAGATERFAALDAAGEHSAAYFVHGLAAELAETTAEWMHQRIRQELGLAARQGRRYSWGYPACPDLQAHRIVFDLLPAERALGMRLSSAGQLIPEHSTAAFVVHSGQ
ncbi:MAG: methionine synthase [Anaerolineales bacterium]